VVKIAQLAGDAILPFYQSGQLDIVWKTDDTPLTKADLAAHQVIINELLKLGGWPILSEEGELPSFALRQQWRTYWMIDPLDGTRGFVNGLDEFTVNIALIHHHQPILGVIYAPIYNTVFFAAKNLGAFKTKRGEKPQPIHTTSYPFNQLRLVVGRYHKLDLIQPLLKALSDATLLRLNSSLKFTMIARGQADVYARFGPISEWDIAAGHCILEEAGGKVVDFDGNSLQYNAKEKLLCSPFLAVANYRHINVLIQLLNQGGESV